MPFPLTRRCARSGYVARGELRSPVLQLPLEDLALLTARQRIDEGDLARHLVAGEVLLDVGFQRILADGAPGDHERFEPLAEPLVLDRDGGCLAHPFVTCENLLDLLREDV